MHDFAPYLPLIGVLLGLLSLVAAFRAGRRRRLVENLPTFKTTGVFIGLVELKGTAESAAPLTSYLSGQPCVHYIPIHATLYVMGQARERQDVVAPEITRDDHAPMFLISTRSAEQVAAGMKWGERLLQRHCHAVQYPAGNRAREVCGPARGDGTADAHGGQ